jgi:hypothetical protein
MLNEIMLSVEMLSVVILSAGMLAASHSAQCHSAQCYSAQCYSAQRHFVVLRGTIFSASLYIFLPFLSKKSRLNERTSRITAVQNEIGLSDSWLGL